MRFSCIPAANNLGHVQQCPVPSVPVLARSDCVILFILQLGAGPWPHSLSVCRSQLHWAAGQPARDGTGQSPGQHAGANHLLGRCARRHQSHTERRYSWRIEKIERPLKKIIRSLNCSRRNYSSPRSFTNSKKLINTGKIKIMPFLL